MIVLGYCKLLSKNKVPMAKVQCSRDFSIEESARYKDGVAGSCIEDVWLYDSILEKITPDCIGKEMNIVGTFRNGRMVVTDVSFK